MSALLLAILYAKLSQLYFLLWHCTGFMFNQGRENLPFLLSWRGNWFAETKTVSRSLRQNLIDHYWYFAQFAKLVNLLFKLPSF